MAQNVCFLCRTAARLTKAFDRDDRSLLTAVDCPSCGPYRLRPQTWTSHERRCLAAYVLHEKGVGRQPPVIDADNWQTLVKLGETILVKSKSRQAS